MRLVISGGSGSVGRAILANQPLLQERGIKRLRIISRDEQKQVYIQRNYSGDIPLDCYLGDVSDRERMQFALEDADFVIHAAAQKHIEKFELDVKTGYKTNIVGTENVAQSFLRSTTGKRAIFVSTDKAALPITSYGVSKLAAEHIWLWHNSFQKKKFYSVARYGNVFGSRGSVIETWTAQSKRGNALTVTNSTCTRFFMTVDSAAKFVLNSLFDSKEERNIPTMKATKMLRLAEMIWHHWNPGKVFDYKEVGYRSAEKQHELLIDGGLTSDRAEQFSDDELKAMYQLWLGEERPNLL
jgi:UDP-N-acetylglucosamine 4,6-dehydratase